MLPHRAVMVVMSAKPRKSIDPTWIPVAGSLRNSRSSPACSLLDMSHGQRSDVVGPWHARFEVHGLHLEDASRPIEAAQGRVQLTFFNGSAETWPSSKRELTNPLHFTLLKRPVPTAYLQRLSGSGDFLRLTGARPRVAVCLLEKAADGALCLVLPGRQCGTGGLRSKVHIQRHIGVEWGALLTCSALSVHLQGRIGSEEILELGPGAPRGAAESKRRGRADAAQRLRRRHGGLPEGLALGACFGTAERDPTASQNAHRGELSLSNPRLRARRRNAESPLALRGDARGRPETGSSHLQQCCWRLQGDSQDTDKPVQEHVAATVFTFH